jgi:hypothetical protein
MRLSLRINVVVTLLVFAASPLDTATAQSGGGRYFPLDHQVPGMASRWARTIPPRQAPYVQPVQIELPSSGLISFFDGSPENAVLTQAPSQVGMAVGQTYRVRISGMPEFPGAELYPSIELIDRLHPPAGREAEFPIPIQLTEEEIAIALDDRLVTKVVYLEQPQLAHPQATDLPLRTVDLPPSTNLLQAADERGRAMAIIRLGGRVPSPNDPHDARFFGPSAPVVTHLLTDKMPSPATTSRRPTSLFNYPVN